MLSAGFAALVAVVVTWTVADTARHDWIASLLAFSLVFAFTLLASAIGAILLMPTPELSRPIRRGGEAPLPALLALMLVGLAAAAVLQLLLMGSSWTEDHRLLVEALGTGPDLLGLRMIPSALLYSMPSLATAALVTCTLASLLGTMGRAELVVQVLMSCLAMQAGLAAGVHLLLWEFRQAGTQLLMLFADARDPAMSARATEWFAAHEAVAGPASWRLVWILGGSLAAVAISEVLAPRRSETQAGAAAEPDASASTFTVAPAVPLPQPVPVSSASSAFDYSNYCVKPRRTFLQSMFLRWYPEYDIQTIPPMSRARFSFSWKTGIIRREPNGPDLLTLEAERQSLLNARSYLVSDAASGASLGTLVSNWPDWEIIGPLGNAIGRLEKVTGDVGLISYAAIVNEEIVCRFTWGMPGYLSHSSELEVEFLRGTHARFERAIMIALAPILEHKARMASERATAR
jgi:hypothetical protein